ncbi:hypothetical protein MOB23_21055, partial [Bacillus haynesii]|nr:hypothetical protein [Bacillus haynesii]
VREFKSLYEKGVRNIVDVTNIGMGRNITYVQKVAEETGINIVFSTIDLSEVKNNEDCKLDVFPE